MNNLGLVTSSYGEIMTKLYQQDTSGLFLPNNTFVTQQLQTGVGHLKASINEFVIEDGSEFRYLCEYIGKFSTL